MAEAFFFFFGEAHLEEIIRRVVNQHDERPGTDIVHTPREADEEDCGYMVNYLLFKVLQRRM